MTLKEAKMTIYANVVYACEEAGFQPMTIKLVKEACDTVIALAEQADTPQTDCNTNQCVQRVEYVGNDEKSRCWTCKHFERMHETPISSDGSYCIYVVCTAKECNYEPKGEPQTDCGWK